MDEIVKKNPTSLDILKTYARNVEVQERFTALLGPQGGRQYVESILIAVANNEALQSCSAKSIMIAGMRAASLRLSVDPILKQAHLVPFGKEATLIPDYHGLVMLTEQTAMYSVAPNVFEVYTGEKVDIDRFSGRVTLSGSRSGDAIIGWCGYFKFKTGTERYLYMTNEEIDAHAKKYNLKGFTKENGIWKKETDKMRRKTVLRILVLRWGHFSPAQISIIQQDEEVSAEFEADFPDDTNIVVIDHNAGKSENMLLSELGFDVDEPAPAKIQPGRDYNPYSPMQEPAHPTQQPPAVREIASVQELDRSLDEMFPPAISPEEAEYINACEMISASSGARYGDQPTDKLAFVANNPKTAPDKKRAAEVIIAWRNSHPTK